MEKTIEIQLAEQRKEISDSVVKAHWTLFNTNSMDQSDLATFRRQVISEVRFVTERIVKGGL